MQLSALAVNTLWSASNLPLYWRFRKALRDPQAAQVQKLRGYLRRNACTAFGKAHAFDQIRSYEEFVRQVPLADYDSFEPCIKRIREGEPNVLTSETVIHLIPTSGSTGAQKLIPFTKGLQGEFDAAVGPWLLDLQMQFPTLAGGKAYWSITPAFKNLDDGNCAIPIGFDSDTAYLGGTRRRLAEAIMAVPSEVQRAKTLEEFRFQTLLHLMRCRELRLVSIWHPSFLTLLLDALPEYWAELLNEFESCGTDAPGFVRRANELRKADPLQPETVWPKLKLISCWGDGNAELAIGDLERRFPNAFIQRKGLLATEAVVTIPFAGNHVLAVSSHFFEFVDGDGRVHLANDLRRGEEYELVVTMGGGLCRYRLQDRVLVTGFLERTPNLKFLGRTGNVSDRFGEKLSDAFVNGIVQELIKDLPSLPRFVLIAPDETTCGVRYTIYLEGRARPEITEHLDALLRKNPHYALCRDLGQLQAPGLFLIPADGYATFAREVSKGKRLGDIKPASLSAHTGWSNRFNGHYSTPDTSTNRNVSLSQAQQQSSCPTFGNCLTRIHSSSGGAP